MLNLKSFEDFLIFQVGNWNIFTDFFKDLVIGKIKINDHSVSMKKVLLKESKTNNDCIK